MTDKERILTLLNRLDDDVSIEQVIHHLEVLRKIEIGIAQADRGEGIEHEAFMKELLEDEEDQAPVDAAKSARSSTDKKAHRARRSKNRAEVH